MRRKTILEKRLARLKSKKEALAKRALESQDVNEVRSINEKLSEINEEIDEAQEEIDAIIADEKAAEQRSSDHVSGATPIPANANKVNGNVAGSFQTQLQIENRDVNPIATMEYRKAFMAYVQNGTPIPAEVRGEAISSADTYPAIPLTIMNNVINTVRLRYGNQIGRAHV